MKTRKKELDVDFIQSKPLTKGEEKKLSEYIKQAKSKSKKSGSTKAA